MHNIETSKLQFQQKQFLLSYIHARSNHRPYSRFFPHCVFLCGQSRSQMFAYGERIGVGSGSFLGVQRIYCPNFPKLARKFLCEHFPPTNFL